MYSRNIRHRLLASLADTPVVLVHGARQVGKTTLVRQVASVERPASYITLDNAGALSAARADPVGFVAGLPSTVVIDEIQRAPDLLLVIKRSVDEDRRPGRFLLTGSASVLFVPHLSETLAGRMEILTLWPLSQGELAGAIEGFVDAAFGDALPTLADESQGTDKLIGQLLRGGYPEVLARPEEERRRAWFGSYLTTILQRDVRDMAHIEKLTELPRLLAALAARVPGTLNAADLSRVLGLSHTTLRRYLSLLEATFLIQTVPAWASNFGKRLVRAPKLFISDTGLMAYLLGITAERLAQDHQLLGPLLEDFVATELRKQCAWSRTQPQIFHFRTHAGPEVDLVLEDASGRVVGVEVKASATLSAADLKGLRTLAEATGERFARGVILYTGSEVIPFGPRLHALPISALWRLGG